MLINLHLDLVSTTSGCCSTNIQTLIASSSATLAHGLGYGGQYVENGETKNRFIMMDDGDEGIMEVMGYKLIQGLTWEEAIKLYSLPVFLNRTYAQQLFPDGNLPVGDMLVVYDEYAS